MNDGSPSPRGAFASALPWAAEHEQVRALARRFFESECLPHQEAWAEAGLAPPDIWRRAGELGLLCPRIPAAYGGADGDFLFSVALIEEQVAAGVVAPVMSLHSDVVAPYILHYGTAEQKARVLPKLASGEWIGAIAMTEPQAGSDLKGIRTRARRDGSDYVVDGRKIFISNGAAADLVVLAARTDAGFSLFLVETRGLAGFDRSPPMEKIGQHAADIAELSFDTVRLPADALLGGEEGKGFRQLVERLVEERLLTGVAAVAMMEAALRHTLDYTRGRTVFGRPVSDFQNSRFKLADAKTDISVARIFLERCISRFMAGTLAPAEAAMLKYWTTERQWRVVDDCLQLHGGYGYMLEYPISRLWLDSRVARIYGGANEIMKEVIAREL